MYLIISIISMFFVNKANAMIIESLHTGIDNQENDKLGRFDKDALNNMTSKMLENRNLLRDKLTMLFYFVIEIILFYGYCKFLQQRTESIFIFIFLFAYSIICLAKDYQDGNKNIKVKTEKSKYYYITKGVLLTCLSFTSTFFLIKSLVLINLKYIQ